MKDKFLAYLRQARTLWGSLSRAKQILLLVITGSVLVGALTITAVQSHVSYSYLFTDLSQQDAAGIVAKLNELKIPHRIEANGSAILVPNEQVHEVRLQLAGMGLPRGGGIGFEIFDQSQFGATEFEQQVNFRRALEGELSRTIANIDSVRSARVHLVLPENSVFVVRRQTGSASVALTLEPGREFGKREVKAVVHLVAAAVPGLSPDRVSVVSSDGVTLHRPRAGEDGAEGVEDPLAERELEMAMALERRVQALLERVVGANRADVRVKLTLDPRVRERTEEHFNPKSTALRSEHRSTEGMTTARDESGTPGPESNLPETSDAEGEEVPPEEDFYVEADEKSAGSRETITRNWEIDRVTEKTKTPAGGIHRLSVAVLVDGVYETKDGNEVFRTRSEDERTQLASLVKTAVGFDGERGDTVTVESARFVDRMPDEPVTAVPPSRLPGWFRWYHGAIAGGVVLAVVVGAGMMLRRRRALAPAEKLALKGPDAVVQLGAALGDTKALPEPRVVDLDALRMQAVELAQRDPATASAIVREWLNAAQTPHPNMSAAPIEVEG